MLLRIGTERRGNVALVHLNGKLMYISQTAGPDKDFADEIRRVIESGCAKIILDMEHVTVIDTAGIGELVAAYKRCRDAGGEVVILRPSKTVNDHLTITKLNEIFGIYASAEDAVAHFGSNAPAVSDTDPNIPTRDLGAGEHGPGHQDW